MLGRVVQDQLRLLARGCSIDLFAPSAHLSLAVLVGQDVEEKTGENHAQVDCRCLCSDLGVISTGFATRIPPSAGPTGRSSPRSMRRRYAHGEWCLRENSRPPCRQQVRPRAHLLKPRTRLDAGIDIQPWTWASIKNAGPMSRYWHLGRCP